MELQNMTKTRKMTNAATDALLQMECAVQFAAKIMPNELEKELALKGIEELSDIHATRPCEHIGSIHARIKRLGMDLSEMPHEEGW